MKKCWAEGLGGCADNISREHLVSASLFIGETVTVKGMRWCKDVEREIGLSNLTSKILCKKHNSDLSEIDVAGANSFATLRQAKKQFFVRQELPPRRWTISHFYIDGAMLERWFLKTGINLIYYDQKQLKDENQSPDNSLLEVIYGERNLKEHAGLYLTFSDGQAFSSADTIEYSTLSDQMGRINGHRFTFQGFRFWISLITKKLTETGSHQVTESKESWGNSKLIYHPSKVRIKQGKHVSQIIHFKW